MLWKNQHLIGLQLGEGGYSFVYLAREIEEDSARAQPQQFALKKVLASTAEQLALARQEMAVMRSLQHPNLLPLLAHSITQQRHEGAALQVVYMLFPLYEDGSLMDLVSRQHAQRQHLPAQDILQIFLQVCQGVQAMHRARPPLAHRDIKPHNILLQQLHKASLAMLMDFGSARSAPVEIQNRTEALTLQEDAEAHCTAPYKAPELYDVPSQCTIDQRIDIWSLGCVLYFMMYGVSPFERATVEAGGSLALAVINNNITYPSSDPYTAPLRSLIEFCLVSDHTARPHIDALIQQCETAERQLQV
eukprot:jgi/Astpho2/9358/e_gw1.00142.26.1_t